MTMNPTAFSYYENCVQNNLYMNYFHSYFGETAFDLSLPKEDYSRTSSCETPQEFPLNLSVTNAITEPQTHSDEDMPIDYSLPKVSTVNDTSAYYRLTDSNLDYFDGKRKRRIISESDSEGSTILQIDEDVHSVEKECKRIRHENTAVISRDCEINKMKTNINTQPLNMNEISDSGEHEQTLLSAHRILIEKYQQQIQQHSNQINFKEIRESHVLYCRSSYRNLCSCRFTQSTHKIPQDEQIACKMSCEDPIGSSLLSCSHTKELSTDVRECKPKGSKGPCRKCIIDRKRKLFKQKRLNSYFANLPQNFLKSRKKNSTIFCSSAIESPKNSGNSVDDGLSIKPGVNEDHSYCKKTPENDLPEFPLEIDSVTTKVPPKSKKQCKRCSLCLNHGAITKLRGHIGNCQYQFCKCERCLITKARQLHMLRQQRLTRQMQREKKRK